VVKLTGKVAVITGGASGIGRATAALLAKEGAKVVVADLNKAAAEEVAHGLAEAGFPAHAVGTDVSITKSCKSLATEVIDIFGGIDILVNNAGMPMPKSLDQLSGSDWDRTMAVNLKGVFLCTKFVFPHMKSRGGGSIVNTSSITGLIGSRGQSAYCVSKAGIISFTQCMALELAPFNIRVNCICPGFTDTPMLRQFLSEWFPDKQDREEFVHDTEAKALLNRYGTPQEMAKAVLFLASDDSSFITGQALPVDGGTGINIL
jgi:NAD(P)-dependent dehydrogenase (short-subunit alcohol dehydrogenase family)